jgi:hypothetical protein
MTSVFFCFKKLLKRFIENHLVFLSKKFRGQKNLKISLIRVIPACRRQAWLNIVSQSAPSSSFKG